jgi:hypothetical protein
LLACTDESDRMRTSDFRYWRIVLKKSCWGGDQCFSGPLMRFARGDLRGPHRFTQNDHGASYGRYAVLQWWSRLKISFARFSASFNFRLLQHYRRLADLEPVLCHVPYWGKAEIVSGPGATWVRCCREVRQISEKRTTLLRLPPLPCQASVAPKMFSMSRTREHGARLMRTTSKSCVVPLGLLFA